MSACRILPMALLILLPAATGTGIVPPDLRPHLYRLLLHRSRRIMIGTAALGRQSIRSCTHRRTRTRRHLILPDPQLTHIGLLLPAFPDTRRRMTAGMDAAMT